MLRIASGIARKVEPVVHHCSQRAFSLAVLLQEHGQATSVYKLGSSKPVGSLASSEVALKFLAAPINPADINVAEGVYGNNPKLPTIGGSEGVAIIEEVGSGVKGFSKGDWVVPAKTTLGTWRQAGKADESDLLPVPNDIPIAYAATIVGNPGSAYRMLRDFVQLKKGDVIIQNAANSMVGLAVIQMAREMGVKTINIVRSDRPDVETTIRLLTNLGGDVNVTDAYLNTAEFNEIMAELPPCKLALNAVGGEVATDMARVLGAGGTMVTYGGMSKQPVTLPYELLSYRQLNMRGFWMQHWSENHSREEKVAMINDIAAQIKSKKLSFFFKMHDLDDFDFALQKSVEPYHFRKVVLNLDYPDRLKEHDARDIGDYKIFDAPV